MKRKSLELTFIFGLITLVQLVSQIVTVRLFGASFEYDAFLAAVALPTVLVTVVYGTLNDAFLPIFAHKNKESESESKKYFSESITTLFTLGILFSFAVYILVLLSKNLIFGNLNQQLFTAALPLFQIMVWITPFAIVATVFGSLWYFKKKYAKFPLAQLLGAVSSLLVTIILFKYIGIWSLVAGFLFNIISQFVIVFPKSSFVLIKPNSKIVLPLLISWLPLIVSNFAVRSDTLLMRAFGSQLGQGELVYLNLVTKMYSLGSGIVTIGLQVLLLPNLLEKFVDKKYIEADRLVTKAKMAGMALSVVSSLLILMIGPLIIKYLFVGGKYNLSDYTRTISLFPIFLWPSFAWGLNSIFFQPLIALKKTWLLGIINIVSLFIAWLVTTYLFTTPSVQAIAIGLSILLFGGIIGSEIVWQMEKKKILS